MSKSNWDPNAFWRDDAATRPISFDGIPRVLSCEELAEAKRQTPPPVRFLGCELPWEFAMPTAVTGVPHGFDLYRLALDGAGQFRPDAFGPVERIERTSALTPAAAPAVPVIELPDAPWSPRGFAAARAAALLALHQAPASGSSTSGSGLLRWQ